LKRVLSQRSTRLRSPKKFCTGIRCALSEIGAGVAIPALRTALAKEQDADARKAEVRALIHSGERTERLTELLESNDPEVRAAAIRGVAGRHGVDPWPEPRPRPFP
jgi:HEAT repeat protein